MKSRASIPIMLTLMLATLNGGTLLAQRNSTAAIARLIEARGTVELKQGTSNYRLAKKDENLYFGDLLKVQRGSKAVIQCTSDTSTWAVPDDGIPWGVASTCSLPR
ncbi:MAG TPA: hypothetical protein DD379_17925 [Cyanobacteria bacterium UBA11162]|nr:hypothetical protein [Cyanobacteria bacterium UBA11162]